MLMRLELMLVVEIVVRARTGGVAISTSHTRLGFGS
jgi:hypothetical protein